MTIAIVLAILWVLGYFVFHLLGGWIHILLILAVIFAIMHMAKKQG